MTCGSSALIPAIPGEVSKNIIDKVGREKIKFHYFAIRFPAQWEFLQTYLNEFEHIEHLHLHVWLYNEFDCGDIRVAEKPIEAKIDLLTVDDNHYAYSSSFKILSSFTNAREYSVDCDVTSNMFKDCILLARSSPKKSAPRRLSLTGVHPEPSRFLLGFPRVTHLSLDKWFHHIPGLFDFEALHLAAPDLEVLTVQAQYKEERRKSFGFSCMNPADVARCLRFSKLRSVHFWGLPENEFNLFQSALQDFASDEKNHRQWPEKLDKIVFSFEKDKKLTLVRDEFGVKLVEVSL